MESLKIAYLYQIMNTSEKSINYRGCVHICGQEDDHQVLLQSSGKLQMISLQTDNILNTFEDAFKYIICYSEHFCRYSTYTCHYSIAITL